MGTSSLIKNALFFWCNTLPIPEELCLWFCPLKSNIYILYLLQWLSVKRKCFLSSLTCEQVVGQAGKMSLLMLSDTDHMNIYRRFLKCKVVFPNFWHVWRVLVRGKKLHIGGAFLIFLLFLLCATFCAENFLTLWSALGWFGCCGLLWVSLPKQRTGTSFKHHQISLVVPIILEILI